VAELEDACRSGQLKEAFGAGTAAVVAPIGHIHIQGIGYDLPDPGPAARMYQLRNQLTAIRTGESADPYNWNTLL
jgi:branched-chain amino acid aminotransferase